MVTPDKALQRAPSSVRLEEDGIHILWADGHESFYPHRYLRSECRCAHCIEEMSGRRLVFLENIDPEVQALDWMRVGNYALAFLYSDAHDTGIYPFDLLRSLCQCPAHLTQPPAG